MRCDDTEILRTLSVLEDSYDSVDVKFPGNSQIMLELISKLAVLEVGGWIETTMDDIVMGYVNRVLTEGKERDTVKTEIVGRTHGFDPIHNVQPLLERILGLWNYVGIKRDLESKNLYQTYVSEMGNLYRSRNHGAHTFSQGTTPTFEAPSTTKNRFKRLFPAIRRLEELVELLAPHPLDENRVEWNAENITVSQM